MRRTGLVAIALVAAVTVGCNRESGRQTSNEAARDTGAVGTSGASKVSGADKDFVRDVAMANMAEVDLAKTAEDHAASPDVKKFAEKLIDDHTSAGEKLKAIASEQNIEWPAQGDDKHRDKAEDLSKKQGPDFDRDYIAYMVDAHNDLIDKLESRIDKKTLDEWKAAESNRATGQKAEVKGKTVEILPEKSDNAVTARVNQWAAEVYPVAAAHREMAKSLDSMMKRRHTNP